MFVFLAGTEVNTVCVWYYAESQSLSYFIPKAQQMPLAHEIMVVMSRSAAMSGNIRPTDMTAVLPFVYLHLILVLVAVFVKKHKKALDILAIIMI